MKNPQKIARLIFNDRQWQEPSGKSNRRGKTFQEINFFFGHEEWLFDTAKSVDDYLYGFIEGATKATYKGNTYDLRLFTVDSLIKRRYWVAEIRNCYVLKVDEKQPTKRLLQQWIASQKKQLSELRLPQKSIGNLDSFAPNVRFSAGDYTVYPLPIPISEKSDVYRMSRFGQFFNATADSEKIESGFRLDGRPPAPLGISPQRTVEFSSREIEQKHRQLSLALFKKLKSDYASCGRVTAEARTGLGTIVDIVVEEPDGLTIYEIKTYPQLQRNIREAVGQLLEYAYWQQTRTIKELVIVSDCALDQPASEYLNYLREQFRLPISFSQVPL